MTLRLPDDFDRKGSRTYAVALSIGDNFLAYAGVLEDMERVLGVTDDSGLSLKSSGRNIPKEADGYGFVAMLTDEETGSLLDIKSGTGRDIESLHQSYGAVVAAATERQYAIFHTMYLFVPKDRGLDPMMAGLPKPKPTFPPSGVALELPVAETEVA